jgi:hypothetical protein
MLSSLVWHLAGKQTLASHYQYKYQVANKDKKIIERDKYIDLALEYDPLRTRLNWEAASLYSLNGIKSRGYLQTAIEHDNGEQVAWATRLLAAMQELAVGDVIQAKHYIDEANWYNPTIPDVHKIIAQLDGLVERNAVIKLHPRQMIGGK